VPSRLHLSKPLMGDSVAKVDLCNKLIERVGAR
jgi:hypothetical protein